MTGNYRDSASGDSQLGCKKIDERIVSRTVDWRSVKPDLQCRAVSSGDLRSRGARLDVDGETNAAIDKLDIEITHSIRSTAP